MHNTPVQEGFAMEGKNTFPQNIEVTSPDEQNFSKVCSNFTNKFSNNVPQKFVQLCTKFVQTILHTNSQTFSIKNISLTKNKSEKRFKYALFSNIQIVDISTLAHLSLSSSNAYKPDVFQRIHYNLYITKYIFKDNIY